jgi:carbamoyltransferase
MFLACPPESTGVHCGALQAEEVPEGCGTKMARHGESQWLMPNNRARRTKMDAYWDPSYSDADIVSFLEERGAPYRTLTRDEMIQESAQRLNRDQAVIGWFQGRLEWGPRSLGCRSILADPRNEEIWKRVNLKIKYRESFRPFAPAVLAEKPSG